MQLNRLKRREFIAVLGAAAAWPQRLVAQQTGQTRRRLGVILPYPQSDPQSQGRVKALQSKLHELGWIEGQNLQSDYRWDATDQQRIRDHAADLVRQKPDIILANSTPVVAALLRETRTIPIVFVSVTDPIGPGFVASFARPGGNVTGFTNLEPSFGGKMLQMLREISPNISRVAVLYSPLSNPATEKYLPSIETAAITYGVGTVLMPVNTPAELESALTAFGQIAGGGLMVMLDTFVTAHRKLIMSISSKYRIPSIYPVPFFAKEGALIAIGADIVDLFRRAGPYIDRILKGEKPGELPVQAPVKFETIVNLQTARALGLTVPASLLIVADEVVE